MSEIEYHLKFPVTSILFTETTLTFSINHIKSRLTSILYFKLYCYSKHLNNDSEPDTLIYTYNSPRWVIDTEYKRRSLTFEIPEDIVDKTAYTQIELIAIGINSENPLYFTECMLNEGEDIGYHQPAEQIVRVVGLKNSRYINLYNNDGNYLQVIRPMGDNLTTNVLTKSTCSVLAPHFHDEEDIDDPVNIFLEFINQTEQRIDVLR